MMTTITIENEPPSTPGWLWLFAFFSVVAFMGCERPFVDISTPEITVVAPDLSVALLDPDQSLVLQASSFRDVIGVTLNGTEMMRNPSTGNWEATISLPLGLNALIVDASDVDNVTTTDTLYALRIAFGAPTMSASFPSGRGGHTATVLNDGTVTVTGGAATTTGDATDQVFELEDNPNFMVSPARLNYRRVGHSANLLPDGRILIVGGATLANVPTIGSLVEEVEILDPATNSVTAIPFNGSPIRRAYHTSSLRRVESSLILDLYGGLGDVAYVPQPRLGIRSDIRSFELRGDTLYALSPAVGGRLIGPTWGHSQTSIFGAEPAPTQYLISGGLLEPTFTDETAALVDFADPRGLVPVSVPVPSVPRLQHADVRLRSGFIVFFGGRTDSDRTITRSVEIYSNQARRFFSIPVANLQLVERYAHRSVLTFGTRVIITGGFGANGQALATSEVIEFAL